ncbi:MAG: hypothetical protein LBJ11_02295 [Oscillospiraceae bacterium]|jgi:hypothetical protein|nr:hypothetical protein [Oscillospiraceae bacterium]
MMKKFSLLLTILLLMSMLSGCNPTSVQRPATEPPTTSSVEHSTSDPYDYQWQNSWTEPVTLPVTSPQLTGNQAELVYDANDPSYGSWDPQNWRFVGEFTGQTTFSHEVGGVPAIRTFDQKKWTPVKLPDDLTQWNVGSGNYVIMHGRYYYEWLQYGETDDAKQNIRLHRIDAEAKVLEWVDRLSLVTTPFVSCTKLNEDEFLSCYVDLPNYQTEEAIALSVVTKYNIVTGRKTEIIRESYRNIEGWANSTGVLLENVCAMDGKIYAFGRTNENHQYRYYLYLYDADGKLQKKINAQALELTLNNSNMVGMTVVGNYLMFSVAGNIQGSFIYRINADSVTPAVLRKDGAISFAQMNSPTDSSKFPYVIYFDDCDPLGYYPEPNLYGIERKTGKRKRIVVMLHPEKPKLSGVAMDADGNAIFTVIPTPDENHQTWDQASQYYVTDDILLELWKQAPYID